MVDVGQSSPESGEAGLELGRPSAKFGPNPAEIRRVRQTESAEPAEFQPGVTLGSVPERYFLFLDTGEPPPRGRGPGPAAETWREAGNKRGNGRKTKGEGKRTERQDRGPAR